jgi:hypothetical protein
MKTKCRHYNGPVHNDCCAAGVNYRKLGDDLKPGYIVRLPCVVGSPLTKEPVTCDKISLLTEDELKKQEQEITENSVKLFEAIGVIRKTKLQSGHIECPKCKSNLHFSVAKSNGHIWGKCETEKCLSWMM